MQRFQFPLEAASNAWNRPQDEPPSAPAEVALRAVARRWGLWLTACLMAGGVGAAVAMQYGASTYRVEGKLVYHLSKATSPDYESMPLQNFAMLLKSPELLEALCRKCQDIMPEEPDLRDVAECIQYEIPLSGTVLDVRFQWNDPRESVVVLDRLMNLLVESARSRRKLMLEQHVSRCREDVCAADQQLLAYQQSAVKTAAKADAPPAITGTSAATELSQLSAFLHGQLAHQQQENQSAVRLRVRQEEYARTKALFEKNLISEADLKKAEGELEIERASQNDSVRALRSELKQIDGSLAGILGRPAGLPGAMSADGKAISQELIAAAMERQRLAGKLAKFEETQRSRIDELTVLSPAVSAIDGVRSNKKKLFLMGFGGVMAVMLLPAFLLEWRKASRRPEGAAQESHALSNGHGMHATNGALTNGAVASGLLTNGAVANGALTNGAVANGKMTNGAVYNGTAANGAVSNGAAANGKMTNGALTNGAAANGKTSNGSVTNGAAAHGAPAPESIQPHVGAAS